MCTQGFEHPALPVPPQMMEAALTSFKRRCSLMIFKIILPASLAMPSPAYSQGLLGDLLGQSMRQHEARIRAQKEAAEAHRQVVARVQSLIFSVPEAACKLPQNDLEEFIAASANKSELMTTVAKTVFFRDPNQPRKLSGYDAFLESFNADTRRRYAETSAMYAGKPAPVGDIPAPEPQLRVEMSGVRATERIDNGLLCSAQVAAGSLRFPITYNVILDSGQSDGWTGQLDDIAFTEAYALEHPDQMKIAYNGRELSLAEAQAAGKAWRAEDLALQRQREAAIPRPSPAADRGCRSLEPSVAKIIEGNSRGTLKVIEVSTVAGSAGARADSTLSCRGLVITNHGEVQGSFGTTRTPKGQLLVEWRPN